MDTWSSWGISPEEHAARLRARDERDRKAIADLLEARGLSRVAVLVAASEYRCEQVDDFDGGHYEGVFAVPPKVYDHAAVDPVRAALREAARAVITEERFADVRVTVRRSDPAAGWEQAMFARLSQEHAPDTDPGPLLALLPGPTSTGTTHTTPMGD